MKFKAVLVNVYIEKLNILEITLKNVRPVFVSFAEQ